jgi:hypothetical protein
MQNAGDGSVRSVLILHSPFSIPHFSLRRLMAHPNRGIVTAVTTGLSCQVFVVSPTDSLERQNLPNRVRYG